MKTFSRLLVAVLITLGLAACSVDENPGKQQTKNESVYFQFKIDFPSTKSATTDGGQSDDGIEVGQDVENKVTTIMLVLSDNNADNGYTVHASATVPVTAAMTNNYTDYTIPLNTEDVSRLANKSIRVWVFCNPSSDLPNPVPAGYTIKDLKVNTNESIWANNNFLMSNDRLSTISSLPADLSKYNNPDNPYDLGEVYVERSAARFDLKVKNDDHSTDKTFIFPIMQEEVNSNPDLKIQFVDAFLINRSKSFYAVHQVSDNGLPGGTNFKVVGNETDKNYIVDTDADAKYNFNTNQSGVSFTYPLTTPTDWLQLHIPAYTENTNDNQYGATKVYKTDYTKWFYCSENTIPQDAEGANTLQKNGISTGIMFRAKMQFSGIAIDGGLSEFGVNINDPGDDNDTIYVYNNILYGTKDILAARVLKNAPGDESMIAAYELAKSEGGGSFTNAAAVNHRFTVYSPQEIDGTKGYYLQYFYWNRHNDNNVADIMGPMEFAVVRNNVYKLDITSVSKFGHPTDPTHDPDPVEPDNPDEPAQSYFQVTVHVLPWVVRVNNITF